MSSTRPHGRNRGQHVEHQPIDSLEFNPCRPKPSLKELHELLLAIGTLEAWTNKHGQMLGHSQDQIDGVAHFLRTGVQLWTDCVPWDFVQREFPLATPATWWILMQTEVRSDLQLYRRLTYCYKDYRPTVWSQNFARKYAHMMLKEIEREDMEEGMSEMKHYFSSRSLGLEPEALTVSPTPARPAPRTSSTSISAGMDESATTCST